MVRVVNSCDFCTEGKWAVTIKPDGKKSATGYPKVSICRACIMSLLRFMRTYKDREVE